MAAPCPSCNKMCSLENSDPEVSNFDYSGGAVTASVRCVRTSACCGNEMKEITHDMEDNRTEEIEAHEAKFHEGKEQSYEAEEDGADVDESGGGRYAKNMITCTLHYTLTCQGEHANEDDAKIGDFDISATEPASAYEELN